jgi:hypothetical protein
MFSQCRLIANVFVSSGVLCISHESLRCDFDGMVFGVNQLSKKLAIEVQRNFPAKNQMHQGISNK